MARPVPFHVSRLERARRVGRPTTMLLPLALVLPVTAIDDGALRLRSANVVETSPLSVEIPRREILLWIEIEEAPPCPSPGPPVEYGFLLDADRNRSTGLTDPTLDVGIDARVTARCEAGRWSSPVGEVMMVGAAPARLEIRTTVERLPSRSFLWIAYAVRGDRMVGLPAPSAPGTGRAGHSAWAILELSQP